VLAEYQYVHENMWVRNLHRPSAFVSSFYGSIRQLHSLSVPMVGCLIKV